MAKSTSKNKRVIVKAVQPVQVPKYDFLIRELDPDLTRKVKRWMRVQERESYGGKWSMNTALKALIAVAMQEMEKRWDLDDPSLDVDDEPT